MDLHPLLEYAIFLVVAYASIKNVSANLDYTLPFVRNMYEKPS